MSTSTSTNWQLQLLASAWTTLDARDALLPAKLQRAVAPTAMQEEVEVAREARAAFLKASEERARTLADDFMPSDEAARLFGVAARCVRLEVEALPGGAAARCAFGGDKAGGRVQVTLYGNRGGREEVVLVAAAEWVPVLEAAIVACNAIEWLDQEVAAWLDGAKVLTRERADALIHDERLAGTLCSAYEAANAALVGALEGVALRHCSTATTREEDDGGRPTAMACDPGEGETDAQADRAHAVPRPARRRGGRRARAAQPDDVSA